MEVRHDRRDDRRHSDNRVRPAVYRQQRRLFPGARCAHGYAALESEPWRTNRKRADHISGGRQTICHRRLGPVDGDVCAPGLRKRTGVKLITTADNAEIAEITE